MTLKSLLIAINNISIEQDLVQSTMSGTSLYALNPKNVDGYPMLFSAPTGNHRVEQNTTTYEITLYYFDRLLQDSANDIDIYSTSIEQLKNIVRGIPTIDGVLKVEDGYTITNFNDTESFDDRLAGSWATIDIVTDNSVCFIDENNEE